MAENSHSEKESAATDQVGAAHVTTTSEPVATEPLKYVESTSGDSGRSRSGSDSEEKKTRLAAHRTTTQATTTSTFTTETRSIVQPKEKKPWYRNLNPLKWGKEPPVPKERIVSREYGANFFSMLTFQWMAPLMATGYQRTLELNDIWLVNPNRSADVLSAKLKLSFHKRVARGDKYPLLWALHETFKFEFWLGAVCSLTASIFQVLSPFTLKYLIAFATDAYYAKKNGQPAPNLGRGFGFVVGITAMQMLQSLGTNHFIYRGFMVGAQTRGVLITVIFEKAMRLSGRAKAGGRAIAVGGAQEQGSNDDAKDNARAKEGFFKRRLNKKLHPKGGPIVTADKARGVAGDGVGWANGRVVNLMSTDTYRVDQASGMFHLIWTSPVAILITLALLLVNLTYSALAGFGLLVIGLPVLTKAIKTLFVRRRAINKVTDQRVSLTQEILQAVRFVKYFGWESSFLERIREIRLREIRAIQVLLGIRNAINAVSMSLPIFASMLSFITYSLSKHVLDPAPIFSSLALFNSLRMPLNLLPQVIGQVTDAWASMGRIQEFLLAEEQKDDFIWDMEGKNAVVVEHADFTWERTADADPDKIGPKGKKEAKDTKHAQKAAKKSGNAVAEAVVVSTSSDGTDSTSTITQVEPFKLRGMDFTVGRNELLAVIGGVGSGKSSLLAALAGDMRRTSGQITMGATRAFCPQYAWIQNATVKENILFGKDYDRKWYDEVVDACALRPDLEMLPAGDLTEVGERGITVSGGQKQRLNIARAIYFNSDIVLMDDPLSAVDAHVGRHIFDNAICGLLKDKCRILATHQLHVLSRCDRIIWLQEGHIETIDTFDNLMRHNEGFQKMMATTAQEEKVEEEENVNEDEVENEKKDQKQRKQAKRGAALMQQEERAVKSVGWEVYSAYIRASGSILNGPLVFALLVLTQCGNIATSLWLSYWTSNKFGYSEGQYIGVYAALGVTQALLMFAFSLSLSILGTTASRVMLNRAMTRTLRAPMSFFDTTPLGRITNRFAKDVDIMDNNLSDAMRMYFMTLAMIVAVFALIITFFHYFGIALGPLFVMFVFSAGYYRASAREVKRHEAVLRSVVFARFSEAVSGTASIRAYGLENHFVRVMLDSIDQMNSAYYLTFSNQRWLSVRLDAIGNILVFVTGVLVVTSRFNVSPSIGGLVLSYILSIVQLIQFTVRQLAEVENAMNATERIHYYGTQLDEEPPLHLAEVRDSWPEKGEIVFEDVQMRYRAGLPLVLQGLNITVAGGERIGVVGRTGAGKSSIMSTLFRLVELSGGSISIDGVNIATVGLQDLRSRLAIIPQDPTLFKGTIRSNLDPFNEHTDLELWSALRQSDLIDADANVDDKSHGRIHLDGVVDEEGLNFSLGQRQLMALARALVRGSQIIVCDEATSSVDMETDQKIQRTIATGFKGKTLLCIAHRLKTIINYDRICVMDQGRIAELDTPLALWEKGGIFRGMCERSGITRTDFDEMAL
ncbi:abc transporter [Lasallia pustulata]|uniref:Abc transporter n=1 Tax=Lasallia pustulata TaxID=136370 RepID=A0A1W5CZQ9_9LECA|nr:abc transporter [Lasallia pustulata]